MKMAEKAQGGKLNKMANTNIEKHKYRKKLVPKNRESSHLRNKTIFESFVS